MDLLRLIPTCPESWGLHIWQAPMLAWCRPGQWAHRFGSFPYRNSHRESWSLTTAAGESADFDDVLRALAKCEALEVQATSPRAPLAIRAANFRLAKADASGRRFEAHFFTHYKQWLDVVEIRFGPPAAKGEPLTADCHSFSADS